MKIITVLQAACLFLLWLPKALSQKDIVLHDSLVAHSEKYPVKMGSQGLGKMWKIRFGNYGVVTSKAGWITTTSKSNFWNTKTESKTTQKFSFVFSDKTDTAYVNAASNMEQVILNEVPLLPHFSLGSNEIVFDADNYSAFININWDTSTTWGLLMNYHAGNGPPGQAMLTNGTRKIEITRVSSNLNGEDTRSFPATGFEFMEDGNSLAALQNFGGGLGGSNRSIVWLRSDLDNNMKLILAAAATAILEFLAPKPG